MNNIIATNYSTQSWIKREEEGRGYKRTGGEAERMKQIWAGGYVTDEIDEAVERYRKQQKKG